MNRDYWNLFWTTGMPEAWMMSRDRKGFAPAGADQRGRQALSGPLAGFQPRLSDNLPGGPKNLY